MAGRAVGRDRVRKMWKQLQELHPDAHCELDYKTTFQLLVAVVLSAQTTDKVVNQLTPGLFGAYPDAESLSRAEQEHVEGLINRMGMYRQKSKNIIGLSKILMDSYGGEVPRSMDELVALPGVGRKTANVVLGVAFRTPEGVVVDTHVQRISQRLGWTLETTAPKIEQALMKRFARKHWDQLSHVLIFHGRRVCFARKPSCATCGVAELCPNAGNAEHVGRKPPKKRSRAGSLARWLTFQMRAHAARGKYCPMNRDLLMSRRHVLLAAGGAAVALTGCGDDASGRDVGSPAPTYSLEQVQPKDPRFGEFHGLDVYRRKTMVVALFAGWCSYCVGQMSKLEEQVNAMAAEGYPVVAVVINEERAASDQEDLYNEAAIPILQDTVEAGAWEAHGGRKNDLYVFDRQGILRTYIDSEGGVITTNLFTETGSANLRNAVTALGKG